MPTAYNFTRTKICQQPGCGVEVATRSGTMLYCEAHRAEATRKRSRDYNRKQARIQAAARRRAQEKAEATGAA